MTRPRSSVSGDANGTAVSAQQIVPSTRLGLALSIAGFAVAVTLLASDAARSPLGTLYGLAWVLLVAVMAYPPRWIRPDAGWARARCRERPAAVLYVTAVGVAVGGATWALSAGVPMAIGTGAIIVGIVVLAATLPGVTRKRRTGD